MTTINWSTVAPETRLYKGKNIFRWEVSPGLEHHCGICSTPLRNARAKTSCIGKHVEPCYRFHQQLHFKGKSHECFSCNTSDEMHHNRHKEILKLVRQINSLDDIAAHTLIKLKLGAGTRRDSFATTSIVTPPDTSSEKFGGDGSDSVKCDSRTTRRRRKKERKSGYGSNKDRERVEAFPREEIDFVSEAIHLTVLESKGAWEGTYSYSNFSINIKSRQIDGGEEAIEGEGLGEIRDHDESLYVKPPYEMTPRQRKTMKKLHTPIKYSSFRGGSQKYIPDSGKKSNLYNGADPAVFFRLGIEVVNPPMNSKSREELVAKLAAAVKEDLEIIEREGSETALREEGFWRWAGKAALHHINATREGIDWATGQKKGARIDAGKTVEPEEFTEIPHNINSTTKEPTPTPATVATFPPLTPIKGPARLPVRTPTLRILTTSSKPAAPIALLPLIFERSVQAGPTGKSLQPVMNSFSKHKRNKTISHFNNTKVVTQACEIVYGKPIMWSKAVLTNCAETSNVPPAKPLQAAENTENKPMENSSDGGDDGEWEVVVRYKRRAQGNQVINKKT